MYVYGFECMFSARYTEVVVIYQDKQQLMYSACTYSLKHSFQNHLFPSLLAPMLLQVFPSLKRLILICNFHVTYARLRISKNIKYCHIDKHLLPALFLHK